MRAKSPLCVEVDRLVKARRGRGSGRQHRYGHVKSTIGRRSAGNMSF